MKGRNSAIRSLIVCSKSTSSPGVKEMEPSAKMSFMVLMARNLTPRPIFSQTKLAHPAPANHASPRLVGGFDQRAISMYPDIETFRLTLVRGPVSCS